MRSLAQKVFGSANERVVKRMRPAVDAINQIEPRYEPLDADGLRRTSGELRERSEKGEALGDLLPEAFALVREAAKRALGQRHYDVQLIGGMVLHQGKIAEMKTGEGKTLVATLASFLNALPGKGVHVVTVNDYLAKRDAEWMGAIHRMLGLEVGCIVAGLDEAERRAAYHADITYGQNNEFGFDYLRDNMKPSLELFVQRDPNFAIVDEVDSILIDEARTPLIISGPVEDDPGKFSRLDKIAPKLVAEDDYTIDEKARTAMLTDEGVHHVEKLLGIDNLYSPDQMDSLHVIQNALKAHTIYKRDVDYVVKDGQVVIVDEFTGRLMEGRRWSDGIHQAVEAKEGVKVQNETQTYASITFQNYFRMYEKLSGMTGTADTEAAEFAEIYDLEVVIVPTNRPLGRVDADDVVYRTRREKWDAVVEEIGDAHRRGQPTLVGTVAIETSELLSKKLKNRGVPHNILNAKQHQREAEIISQAGRKGAVTISTNMAGRGTDIVLGGNPEMTLKARGLDPEDPENAEELGKLVEIQEVEREEVLGAGGLHVLGTERHESRRIDNQLRGRSGRQGDAGSSRFYLSLEDDLLRIFGGERLKPLMERLGMEEGEAIEAKMLSRQIERAQRRVETRNFDVRKHLLEYDNVMNKQRESIYGWRHSVLSPENEMEVEFREMALELAEEFVEPYLGNKDESDVETFVRETHAIFGIELDPEDPRLTRPDPDGLRAWVSESIESRLAAQLQMFEDLAAQIPEDMDIRAPTFDEYSRDVLREVLDAAWKDHLLGMDHLKEGIGLRGYGQRDPKVEYQREGYDMFLEMRAKVAERAVQQIFNVAMRVPTPQEFEELRRRERARREQMERRLQTRHAEAASATVQARVAAGAEGGFDASQAPARPSTIVREGPKVGRNDPCTCGSGKKYKKCCGAA